MVIKYFISFLLLKIYLTINFYFIFIYGIFIDSGRRGEEYKGNQGGETQKRFCELQKRRKEGDKQCATKQKCEKGDNSKRNKD